MLYLFLEYNYVRIVKYFGWCYNVLFDIKAVSIIRSKIVEVKINDCTYKNAMGLIIISEKTATSVAVSILINGYISFCYALTYTHNPCVLI